MEMQGKGEAQTSSPSPVGPPARACPPDVIAAPPARLPWAPYRMVNPIAEALEAQGATDEWVAGELLKIYRIATRERDGQPDYRLKKQILEYIIELKGYQPVKHSIQEVHRSSFEMAMEINPEDYLLR